MTTQAAIQDFLAQRTLAVIGVSRDEKMFSTRAYRELKAKGYQLFAVNPSAESIGGERCYSSLAALPEPVGGALIIVPPTETERVVREAAAAGIRRVWMQQGAESEAAIRFCQENGISTVSRPKRKLRPGSVAGWRHEELTRRHSESIPGS